jgi:hypothetical protein
MNAYKSRHWSTGTQRETRCADSTELFLPEVGALDPLIRRTTGILAASDAMAVLRRETQTMFFMGTSPYTSIVTLGQQFIAKNSVAFSPQANYTDRPSDRRLSAKLVPTFADRGCCVVSITDSPGR